MVSGKRTADRAAEFSSIGGAPIVDFVNTQAMAPGGVIDKLGNYLDLVAWADVFALVSSAQARRLRAAAGTRKANAALAEVLALRGALGAAFISIQRAKPLAPGLMALLNTILGRQAGHLRFERDEAGCRLRFAMPVEAPAALAALIAREAAAFLSSDELPRIRHCEGSECILWFVDRTKNNSRHWCRMDRCGSRAKSKSYYKRKKARSTVERRTTAPSTR